MAFTRATRRYLTGFIGGCLAYAVVLTGATWLTRRYELDGPALVALALLAALPIAGALAAIGRYLVEESDEYVRRRIVTGMLFSMALLFALCTALGFLQQRQSLAAFDLLWVFPAWCVLWGLSDCWLIWRDHRRTEREA